MLWMTPVHLGGRNLSELIFELVGVAGGVAMMDGAVCLVLASEGAFLFNGTGSLSSNTFATDGTSELLLTGVGAADGTADGTLSGRDLPCLAPFLDRQTAELGATKCADNTSLSTKCSECNLCICNVFSTLYHLVCRPGFHLTRLGALSRSATCLVLALRCEGMNRIHRMPRSQPATLFQR